MFKKVMKYVIIIGCVVIAICLGSIVYVFATKESNGDILSKVKSEIEYLDKKIISIANSLNNLESDYLITNNEIKNEESKSENSSNSSSQDSKSGGESQSSEEKPKEESSNENEITISTIKAEPIIGRDRNNISWEYIQKELEETNSSLSIITIDLNSIELKNEIILDLTDKVDEAIKHAKNKDKKNTLISVANLYNVIPKIVDMYTDDIKETEIAYIKSDIISSYTILENQEWDKINEFLSDADKRTLMLLQSVDSKISKDASIQKLYILLKDYIKSCNEKDIDMSYMKYFYLISELKKM